jgi:glucose dehydrogenase
MAWRKPQGVRFLLAVILLLGMVALVAIGQNAKRINDNALKDAAKSKEDWISYNRDWAETRFSPLDQIPRSDQCHQCQQARHGLVVRHPECW